MALHDALRMLVSEYGSGILRDPCLVSLLGDRGAFEKLPCLRDVMEALASQGILSSLSSAEPSQYPAIVSRAAEGPDLKQGFERSSVLYALESVSFAPGEPGQRTCSSRSPGAGRRRIPGRNGKDGFPKRAGLPGGRAVVPEGCGKRRCACHDVNRYPVHRR